MHNNFSNRLLAWFDKHGRKDLPWQHNPTPYRVWVSEIMLQQTQVSTVVNYYQRFMQAFPSIKSLAEANIDQVLHYWAGLGYYARGRNLHKAARQIMENHNGTFPENFDDILSLPGVGKSTAGAILSLAFKQRQAILDGNVKRVLGRFHAISGWPGDKKIENQLWKLANSNTPESKVAEYTQAIMDLGATLCTRSNPQCSACPQQKFCTAHQLGKAVEFPGKKPKKDIPEKHVRLLLILNENNQPLIVKRPPVGIWGGLWSLPECNIEQDPSAWCSDKLGYAVKHIKELPDCQHAFTHFKLTMKPSILQIQSPSQIQESNNRWYQPNAVEKIGFPTPIKNILHAFQPK
jgi:A/G-specific adenine glycosylase